LRRLFVIGHKTSIQLESFKYFNLLFLNFTINQFKSSFRFSNSIYYPRGKAFCFCFQIWVCVYHIATRGFSMYCLNHYLLTLCCEWDGKLRAHCFRRKVIIYTNYKLDGFNSHRQSWYIFSSTAVQTFLSCSFFFYDSALAIW
jgi:hypothetical protein